MLMSAEEAKARADEAFKQDKPQLKIVEELINYTVIRGQVHCILEDKIQKDVADKLYSLGYKIYRVSSPRGIYKFNIVWG